LSIEGAVLYVKGILTTKFKVRKGVPRSYKKPGPTNEIGVFEMQDKGLKEVPNPSTFFLAERPQNVAGSVVVSSMEGTRPILVEIIN